MKAIQTNIGKIDVQEFLNAIAEEKIFDIEQLMKQIKQILDQKKSPDFLKKEQTLIDKIQNGGLSKESWESYYMLADKSDKKNLTASEKTQFQAIVKTIRQWELERIKFMLDLAELWNVSLEEVQGYFEIVPQENTHV